MHSIQPRLILGLPMLMMSLAGFACSNANSSPTTPTTTVVPPTSTVAPPTPPSQTARVLEFTPDTATPIDEAVAITFASRAQEPGKIALAVTAFNLVNRSNLSATPGITGVWGRVQWDQTLLTLDGSGSGDLMRQDAVLPSCCNPGEADNAAMAGTFPFSIQRAPGSAPVTGSGEIVVFRLVPLDGVVSGSTHLTFTTISPSFPEQIRFRPFPTYRVPQNLYGGTVTIR